VASMTMHSEQLSIYNFGKGPLVASMTMHSEQLSIYNFGKG
jgi:hypothetical protein